MVRIFEISYLFAIFIIIKIYFFRLNYLKRKNIVGNEKLFLGHGISSINYCISTPNALVYFIIADWLVTFIYENLEKMYIGSNIISIMLLVFKVALIISSFLLLNISLYPISEIKHTLEVENNYNDDLKIKFFKTMFLYGVFCFIWDIGILYVVDIKLLVINIIFCPVIFYLGMGDALEHPKVDKKRNLFIRILIILKSHISNSFRFLINKNFRKSVHIEAIKNIKLILRAILP